ncbi:MAG: cytochrome c biogenesis protein CcdA [Spirochaetales bacterium]|nr:cytochrome c biogenesis protein CcdA [Spirochaetales bacterium]
MGIDLNFGLAFVAGVLSFLSPCILPLIPAYLSLMGGTTIQEMKDSGARRLSAFTNTIFFVIGFSIVFMVLGILFSSTFALLGGATQIINIIAGIVVILLGLNFIFDFWKILNIEKRFQMEKRPTSKPAALLFGMAFGAGWSPCIGPILSSILFLAGTSGSLGRGIVLLSIYSIGLGLPFLLTGLFLPFALKQLDKIKKHLKSIKIGSGVFLIFVGALILFGRLQKLNIFLFSLAYRIETWELENPAAARYAFGAVFLAFALLVVTFYIRKIMKMRQVNTGETGEGETLTIVRVVRPVRIVFFLLFLTASILSFSGVLNFSEALTAWFAFQGI